jgi:hypothetical protein
LWRQAHTIGKYAAVVDKAYSVRQDLQHEIDCRLIIVKEENIDSLGCGV